MKRAARASPALATRRPSIESSASALRRDRVRSTVAIGGSEEDDVPARKQAARRGIAIRSRRMTGGLGWAGNAPQTYQTCAERSAARCQEKDVVQRVRPGRNPESTRHVQTAECQAGDGTEDEGRELERVAVWTDVMERRKDQGAH